MTEFVPLSSIIIEDRQRKYFDLGKLLELADDIRQHGLLHAPILQHDSLRLLAGERRLRAIEILHDTEASFMYAGEVVPHGTAPVTRAHPRDALGWIAAELSENISRMDLTWQERSSAIASLQRLRREQNPHWTISDTVQELRERGATSGLSNVSEDLIVAEHLDDTDVAKAKSKQDALKIITRKEHMRRATELGQRFQLESQNQSPHTPIQADAREALAGLPSASFDVILTDPPYGVDAQDFGTMNVLGHQYDDSYSQWRELMLWFAKESFRLASPQSHLYLFCDIRRWHILTGLFTAEGWDVWPRPIIWAKGNGMLPKPDFGPRNTYEAVLFASKGQKKIQVVGLPDVITIPMLTRDRVHGAEKPVELYCELLRRSVMPGANVLDPFMGSGTIFPAANLIKCKATGVEIHPAFFGIAVTRLESTK